MLHALHGMQGSFAYVHDKPILGFVCANKLRRKLITEAVSAHSCTSKQTPGVLIAHIMDR